MEQQCSVYLIIASALLLMSVTITPVASQEATAMWPSTVGKSPSVHALLRDPMPVVYPPNAMNSLKKHSVDKTSTINEEASVTVGEGATRNDLNQFTKIPDKVRKRDLVSTFGSAFEFVEKAYLSTKDTVNTVADTVKTVFYDTPIAIIDNSTQFIKSVIP